MRPFASSSRREGFSLLEVLFAATLLFVMLAGVFTWFQAGTMSVVTTTDHAQARADAIQVLNVIQNDLDRLVIDDMIGAGLKIEDMDAGNFPNVYRPMRIIDLEIDPNKKDQDVTAVPTSGSFAFFAFHHRRYYKDEERMELAGHFIEYQVKKIPDDPKHAGVLMGVNLLRNGYIINPAPLLGVGIRFLDKVKAEELGLSPYHSFEVIIWPRRQADVGANKTRRMPPIKKRFQLKGVESQYACLLSLKRSNAPPGYTGLNDIPEPPTGEMESVYQNYQLYEVPMDWLRPNGLVNLGLPGEHDKVSFTVFKDETVGLNEICTGSSCQPELN
jgi:type II secretory pathway pseudopilin PulG